VRTDDLSFPGRLPHFGNRTFSCRRLGIGCRCGLSAAQPGDPAESQRRIVRIHRTCHPQSGLVPVQGLPDTHALGSAAWRLSLARRRPSIPRGHVHHQSWRQRLPPRCRRIRHSMPRSERSSTPSPPARGLRGSVRSRRQSPVAGPRVSSLELAEVLRPIRLRVVRVNAVEINRMRDNSLHTGDTVACCFLLLLPSVASFCSAL